MRDIRRILKPKEGIHKQLAFYIIIISNNKSSILLFIFYLT